jgi:hypothetical protein
MTAAWRLLGFFGAPGGTLAAAQYGTAWIRSSGTLDGAPVGRHRSAAIREQLAGIRIAADSLRPLIVLAE